MEKELMFFAPVFKTMVWGGCKMKKAFGYNIPSENTGECWAISAHPHGDCELLNGQYKGQRLSKLWEEHRELFGNYQSDRFPLLLKVIDAKNDLSIQVHPDDEYAKINENGSFGKTECWYILDCEDGATLVIGHNAKTRDELCKLIDGGEYSKLIREVPVKKGDFIQIDPGCIHAIKGGIMLLETQQNSDVTYRVYDYNRLFNGKLRELHVEQSKKVITVPAGENTVIKTSDRGVSRLVSCKYYSVEKYVVDGILSVDEDAPFRLVSVVEGSGSLNMVPINKGDHFIVPNGYGKLDFEGKMTIITSIPG